MSVRSLSIEKRLLEDLEEEDAKRRKVNVNGSKYAATSGSSKDTTSADGEAGSSFLNPAEVARQERLRKQREQKVDSQELLRNFLSVFIFRQSFSRILPPRGSRRRRRLWPAWWWRTGRKCGRVFLRSQTRQT